MRPWAMKEIINGLILTYYDLIMALELKQSHNLLHNPLF